MGFTLHRSERRPYYPVKLPLLALTVVIALTSFSTGPLVGEEQATTFSEALTDGKASLSFRYRIETVDTDASEKDATAGTLRTLLSWKSKPLHGWQLNLGAENVAVVGPDDYNNAGADGHFNGVTDRPVIADPAITAVHRASIDYSNETLNASLGRREINWADQRLVGAVGWRQHHQTFDTFHLDYAATDQLTLRYGFLNRVHRIVGNSLDLDGHLAEARFSQIPGGGAVRVYALLLDYDTVAILSRDTWGLELAGSTDAGWLYEAEFALQSDAGDNPNNVDSDYLHLMSGWKFDALTVKAGLEVLSGGPDGTFATPLATLHKFNGWADRFLATPGDGLEDLYISLGGNHGAWGWLAVWHDFDADSGSSSWGSEIDAQVSYKTSWGQTFALKAADYDADQFSADTQKVWLWTQISF